MTQAPSEQVRVGMVGLGLVANSHLKGYAGHPNAEVVAVCDIDKARAEDFARQHGIPQAYSSYDEMLGRAGIDVVSIATPNHLHAPMTLKAAKAVKHVHCEKPFSRYVGEGQGRSGGCPRGRREGCRRGDVPVPLFVHEGARADRGRRDRPPAPGPPAPRLMAGTFGPSPGGPGRPQLARRPGEVRGRRLPVDLRPCGPLLHLGRVLHARQPDRGGLCRRRSRQARRTERRRGTRSLHHGSGGHTDPDLEARGPRSPGPLGAGGGGSTASTTT